MKTMTCKQLDGPCDATFHAETFEEIAKLSQQHGMKMYQEKDESHIKSMRQMQELMKNPSAMQEWLSQKRAEFESLPDDK